jgi:hypothetical protein
MADPLSIAASVAGLVTLAAHTTQLIASISSEVKGRQAEIHDIGQEISAFYLVLGQFEGQVRNKTQDGTQSEGLFALLAGCRRTLESIQDLLGQIRSGYVKGGLSKVQMQWTYSSKMKSLSSHRSLLDKYKATLSIALLVQNV